MSRNIKILVTTAAAAFALSAVAASMAVAAPDEFTSEGNAKVVLTGKQDTTNVFKTTAGSAECKSVTYSGTSESPASVVKVTPTYSECTCIGVACTIDTNGCSFTLFAPETVEEPPSSGKFVTTGKVTIDCTGSNEITLTSSKCIIHVPAQGPLGHILYKGTAAGTTSSIDLTANVSGITYKHTEGSGIGKCTTGMNNTGTLEGTNSVSGDSDPVGSHVGIFVK